MRRKTRKRRKPSTFAPSLLDENILNEFGSSEDMAGLNALIIGSSVFELEQALRTHRVNKVIIPLYYSSKGQYDLGAIGRLIHDLLIFTVVEDVTIEFRNLRTQLSFEYNGRERSAKNVCLFSGGTDSYAGVLLTRESFRDVEGVFCAHADQARIIHIVERLRRVVLERKGIDLIKVGVPSIGSSGYAQLRGFLYLLAATVVAHKLGAERILVTECGPTMYQPRFSPLDSITMTTHPFVVRTAARVASLLLDRELKVITPFENLTKAEVIALCPEKQGLQHTHSCITQRFGTHDGTCYGCVIRRLATIAANVEDVDYNKNPINDATARSGNLYTLLAFCYDILTRFNQMEEYETGMIETYHKRDLFRRFALDNFAAIHQLLLRNKRVVRPIRDMYESLAQKLGTRTFDDRLTQLARAKMAPDFKKEAI